MGLEMFFKEELSAEEEKVVEEGLQVKIAKSLGMDEENVVVQMEKAMKKSGTRRVLAVEILYTVTITITFPATDDQDAVDSVVKGLKSNPESVSDAVVKAMEDPKLNGVGGGFVDLKLTNIQVEEAGKKTFSDEFEVGTPTSPSSAISASCMHGMLMAFVCAAYTSFI